MTSGLALCGLVVAGVAMPAHAVFFQPDSASASSEFNSWYDIGNVIDGSGMPVGFGPDDNHGIYVRDTHWTTQAGKIVGTTATFEFNQPVSFDTFYMWNHRSTTSSQGGVGVDTGYAVTEFDLQFYDADDNLIDQWLGLTAVGNMPSAQVYTASLLEDVSSVVFTVQANDGSPSYTGLAEVGFGIVPEPGSLALLAMGGLLVGRRRR